MRSRWFHRPRLHSPAPGLEKKPTWLELFYDLIFVAAFIQLGNGLSENLSGTAVLVFGGVFVPLWVTWTGFTFFVNRYEVDDFAHRSLVLAQMFAVGAMAISGPRVIEGETFAFAMATGVAFGIVSLMHMRAWRQVPEAPDYGAYWAAVFGIASAGWLLSGLLPAAYRPILWVLSTLLVIGAPLSRRSRELTERYPIDFEHLGERYGLLTIIVLGESFVKVLGVLVRENAGIDLYIEASIVLVITASVWWVYFDDVAGAQIRKGRARWVVWLYAHLPLQMAITAVGVATKQAVNFDWSEPATEKYRWLLSGSLALVYFAVAAIDSVTERRQAELSDRTRVNVRILSGAVLLVLAPAGAGMSGRLFLVLVTTITALQVIFDMMMAPFEEAGLEALGVRTIAEIAREPGAGARAPRRDVSEAVRKGTPSELRRDLYFYFMEGSWTRVFAAFAVLFLMANLFFAGLFMLEPGSIDGTHPDSFLDAFFFSVQTISTIGYGGMSPTTTYGHAVVTLEAAMGMIGIAIVTGLVFAKASRPKSSVLFSRSIVLTTMDGVTTMSFRVGNARGNEVVDASMTVSVLKEELSSEGHHFRRVHDVKLQRDRQPMFMLSWAVFHNIDEASPLADIDWNDPEAKLLGIIVTIRGHDGTYGQTIYSRHIYYCEDIRRGHRFVDVISQLDDGRLMIDYEKFHLTVPDHEAMRELGLGEEE